MDNTYTCYPSVEMRQRGAAILRVVADLREHIKGEDVPDSLLADLKSIEDTGRWLASANVIKSTDLYKGSVAAGAMNRSLIPSGPTVPIFPYTA